MKSEFDDIRRAYQRIEAPPQLAAEVRAELNRDMRGERRGWRFPLPGSRGVWLSACAVAAAVLVAVLDAPLPQQSDTPAPLRPSLSTMAGLKPVKPVGGVAVSLSRLPSMRLRALPSQPPASAPQERRDRRDSAARHDEEYAHAVS